MASADAVTAAGTIALQAAANDNVRVASVTFFKGTTVVAKASNAPYAATVPIDADDNGISVFSAVARDVAGNEATSNVVHVDVAIPNFPAMDAFEDGQIDSTQWVVTERSATLSEQNGQLVLTIPDILSDSVAEASITSTCMLQGDFDIRVGYDLATWPEESRVRVALEAGSTTERRGPQEATNSLRAEAYVADHIPDGGTRAFLGTTHFSGSMRIARSGKELTSYHSVGSNWAVINTTTASSTRPVTVSLRVTAHREFTQNPAATVVLDDFVAISRRTPAC